MWSGVQCQRFICEQMSWRWDSHGMARLVQHGVQASGTLGIKHVLMRRGYSGLLAPTQAWRQGLFLEHSASYPCRLINSAMTLKNGDRIPRSSGEKSINMLHLSGPPFVREETLQGQYLYQDQYRHWRANILIASYDMNRDKPLQRLGGGTCCFALFY